MSQQKKDAVSAIKEKYPSDARRMIKSLRSDERTAENPEKPV